MIKINKYKIIVNNSSKLIDKNNKEIFRIKNSYTFFNKTCENLLVKDSITISIKVQNIIAAIYHSCDHFNSFKKCTQCAHVMSQFTYMIFYENLFSRRASSAMFSGTENIDLSRWTNLEFNS